jgi:hypothetical protein
MFESTRREASAARDNWSTAKFEVPESARQDFGHSGQKNKNIKSTGVQSPMEQTQSRRSHVGTRGRVEESVSPPVWELAKSRGQDSF